MHALKEPQIKKDTRHEVSMKSNKREPILSDFWNQTEREPDSTLYRDQLGWVSIRPQIVPEEDEVFDYDNISEVWEDFTIDGHHSPYIIDHSLLVLST